MRCICVLSALLVAVAAHNAQAQYAGESYLTIAPGANFAPERTIQGLELPGRPTTGQGGHPTIEPGIAGIIALGHAFGFGLRAELEGNIRSNTIDGSGATSGTELKYGLMANVYYDIDLARLGTTAVVPYVGAGLGWNHTDWNDVVFPAARSTLRVNSGNDAFAYQLMAGLAIPITDRLSVTAEYRFFSLPNDQKFATTLTTRAGTTTPALKVSGEDNHTFLLGLRYTFLTR
jgi:opacity protein-like surface antigen